MRSERAAGGTETGDDEKVRDHEKYLDAIVTETILCRVVAIDGMWLFHVRGTPNSVRRLLLVSGGLDSWHD